MLEAWLLLPGLETQREWLPACIQTVAIQMSFSAQPSPGLEAVGKA